MRARDSENSPRSYCTIVHRVHECVSIDKACSNASCAAPIEIAAGPSFVERISSVSVASGKEFWKTAVLRLAAKGAYDDNTPPNITVSGLKKSTYLASSSPYQASGFSEVRLGHAISRDCKFDHVLRIGNGTAPNLCLAYEGSTARDGLKTPGLATVAKFGTLA